MTVDISLWRSMEFCNSFGSHFVVTFSFFFVSPFQPSCVLFILSFDLMCPSIHEKNVAGFVRLASAWVNGKIVLLFFSFEWSRFLLSPLLIPFAFPWKMLLFFFHSCRLSDEHPNRGSFCILWVEHRILLDVTLTEVCGSRRCSSILRQLILCFMHFSVCHLINRYVKPHCHFSNILYRHHETVLFETVRLSGVLFSLLWLGIIGVDACS